MEVNFLEDLEHSSLPKKNQRKPPVIQSHVSL